MSEKTEKQDYILQVSHLKKYFPIKGGMFGKQIGAVKAVDDVSFNIKRGTTMGLVGESGCGKSTTGRTLLRLIPKTDGTFWHTAGFMAMAYTYVMHMGSGGRRWEKDKKTSCRIIQ